MLVVSGPSLLLTNLCRYMSKVPLRTKAMERKAYLTTVSDLFTPCTSLDTDSLALNLTTRAIRILARITIRLMSMHSTNLNNLLRPHEAIMATLFQSRKIQFAN
jgi:hypothetical protein